MKTALLTVHEWAPALIIGSDQITQHSFTDSGQIIEKPVLDATARAGKKVSGAAQGALNAFDTAPPAPAAPMGAITAEWLEYEIDSPVQPPVTVRREVFDLSRPRRPRREPHHRAGDQRFPALRSRARPRRTNRHPADR